MTLSNNYIAYLVYPKLESAKPECVIKISTFL